MVNFKPIVLIPISLIVASDPSKTKEAFTQLGVTTWQFFWHWRAWNALVGQYRRGIIDHDQFRANLKKIFPVLNESSDSQIDAAWNAMCVYTDQSTAALHAIQKLVDQGLEVQIYGSSNQKHVEFITQKFCDVSNPAISLPGTCVWSHEVKQNIIGNDFVAYLVNKIKSQKASISIKLLYSQPTNPAPGWQGWLQNPFGKYMFKQAEKHIKKLHESAQNLGFELVKSKKELAEQLLTTYTSETNNNTRFAFEETKSLVFRQTGVSKKEEEVKKASEKQPEVPSSLLRAGICRLS